MQPNLFQITSKIISLAKSGSISHARKLFDEMPKRDTVAWNSMLTCYSQLGLQKEALSLFNRMRISNSKPDNFTFTAILSSCAGSGSLLEGTKIHALVIVFGYQSSMPVNNSLIDMYGKSWDSFSAKKVFEDMECNANEVTWCSLLFAYTNSGQKKAAREVFNSMPRKVGIAWNTMISALGQYGEIALCLDMLKEMQVSFCEPDQWTYSALISACTESSEYLCGCMLHSVIINSGWISAVEINNSILSFYSKLGSLNDVIKVFECFKMLSQVSWNAIIDAYMKAGDIHEALLVFQSLPEKNVVSWTSMITGYARNGYGEEAIRFFVEMVNKSVFLDDFTFGPVLHVCSSLALLEPGKMVHGCTIRKGFNTYPYVGNGLINMYAKCGDLDGSIRAFDDIYNKDLVSFNAMLFALGLHGKGSRALQLYADMIELGIKPDKVTFIGLLVTCSHSGLIEKGRFFFESMSLVHGLPYDEDHVACMVDMLGRGGYLAEAEELANRFSRTSDVKRSSSSGVLLGACSIHNEVDMGARFGEALRVLEPGKEMSYVVRSNLYCERGQWKEAEMVRKAMVDEGLKKMPGCSWIEVSKKVECFVAGNCYQPYMDELCKMLHCIDSEIKNPCFSGREI